MIMNEITILKNYIANYTTSNRKTKAKNEILKKTKTSNRMNKKKGGCFLFGSSPNYIIKFKYLILHTTSFVAKVDDAHKFIDNQLLNYLKHSRQKGVKGRQPWRNSGESGDWKPEPAMTRVL